MKFKFSEVHNRILASFIIALVLGGSLVTLWRGEIYWPFSHYPMYAKRVGTPTIQWVRFYAVFADDPQREVMLVSNDQTYPISNVGLSWVAVHLTVRQDQTRLQLFLDSMLRIYNHRNTRQMRELKAYWGEWVYPSASFDPQNPERRSLVAHAVAD